MPSGYPSIIPAPTAHSQASVNSSGTTFSNTFPNLPVVYFKEEPSSPKLTLLTQNVNGSVAVDFKTEQSEYADAIGGNNGEITFTSDSNGTGSVNAGDVEWNNNNKYLVFKCDISCDGTYSVAFMPNFAEDANVKIGYSMVDVTSYDQALNCTSFQTEGLSFAQLGGDNTIYLVVAIVDINSPATISGGFDVTVNVAESN